MNNAVLIIEKILAAPVERVWKAITDNDDMKKWYFDIEAFKAEPGFEFRFTGVGSDQTTYIHECKVTTVEEGRKLAYTWRYPNLPGISEVMFELIPEGDQTRLILTHTGLDSFGTDHPDFSKDSFQRGWNHIIGTSLKDFVEKQ